MAVNHISKALCFSFRFIVGDLQVTTNNNNNNKKVRLIIKRMERAILEIFSFFVCVSLSISG